MSEEKIPTSFNDYKVGELRTIADEDFAVEAEGLNKQEVLAALAESGVTFDMYVGLHPEIFEKEEEVVEETVAAPGVVTATQMQEQPPVETNIIVKEDVPLQSRDLWLIKMVRENPLYEVRGHRFTQENPYGLFNPTDAEYLLTRLDGFRQATPAELQEYYG